MSDFKFFTEVDADSSERRLENPPATAPEDAIRINSSYARRSANARENKARERGDGGTAILSLRLRRSQLL